MAQITLTINGRDLQRVVAAIDETSRARNLLRDKEGEQVDPLTDDEIIKAYLVGHLQNLTVRHEKREARRIKLEEIVDVEIE